MEGSLPEFPGYQILARVHDDPNTAAFRGIRVRDGVPVLLKMLKPSHATPLGLSRFRNEYEVTRALKTDRVVKVYSLEPYEQTLFLVIEISGGMRLDVLVRQWGKAGTELFPLARFFAIAGQIVEALAEVHAAGVIHKDLHPSAFLLIPSTGKVKIGNFDLATKLSRENPALKHPLALEGALAYMSPEQTGRMNRAIDYRTDFYSLGVTFYEMLTGRLPFESTDAMELVHAHLAKTPVTPCLLNPAIPRVLSDLVMKLMAKAPEDRYQSAHGLKQDLDLCSSARALLLIQRFYPSQP